MRYRDLRHELKAALARSGAASSDFDLDHGVAMTPGRPLREAGVLVGVLETDAGPDLVLTKRSSALKHHPGQISFPGGKVEPTDQGAMGAALREAKEEIGLDPANVEVLGALDSHETVTGFTMRPVLALIRADFTPRAEPGEVAEVFRVPLSHVTDPARFSVQSRAWRGGRRHYFAVPFGPYYIWGATARILHGLAERMHK
ncbi:CoA pyrophosphatase [Oceaniglobus indicus]|uniref:CoA pyrophosphatase n=1 Tax=Oceaniglobus indicus TaxID=2047749 RepID=UPI000C1756F3|nr:CoA pyrophosphatase [Oceaniglobus indicus]